MRITVKLFAILKDRAGAAQAILEDLPPGATVIQAAHALAERFPNIASDLDHVAFAVNRCYTKPQAILKDGDELALIPPVSGG